MLQTKGSWTWVSHTTKIPNVFSVDGGSNPYWNTTVKFKIDRSCQELGVKIFSHNILTADDEIAYTRYHHVSLWFLHLIEKKALSRWVTLYWLQWQKTKVCITEPCRPIKGSDMIAFPSTFICVSCCVCACSLSFKKVFYAGHVVPIQAFTVIRPSGRVGGQIRMALVFFSNALVRAPILPT